MPLHLNESGTQKPLNFSGNDQSCFVKENHHLAQERSTVMTIAFSSNVIKTPPLEFVFKGKGIRVKVNRPERVTAQWSDKGSYRVEHVLKYIESLLTIPIHSDFVFLLLTIIQLISSQKWEKLFSKRDTF